MYFKQDMYGMLYNRKLWNS